jgi:hypothetical protein
MKNTPQLSRLLLCAAVLITSMAAAASDPALLGLWRFNETEGDVAKDASGLDNDGTLNGENGNKPRWVSGQAGFGGALAFINNGTDHGWINVPGTPVLKIGMTPEDTWTLAIWAYESTDGTGDYIATYGRFLTQDNGNGLQWD